MQGVCIICEKDAPGHAVKDTAVIEVIRKIKQKLNMAKNNRLIVCAQCYEDYKKKRKDYEGRMILHILLGALLVFAAIILPLMASRFEIYSIGVVILLVSCLMLLAMLSYVPPIEEDRSIAPPQKQQEAKKKDGGGLFDFSKMFKAQDRQHERQQKSTRHKKER